MQKELKGAEMSAAAKYREIVAEKNKEREENSANAETFKIVSPSGMVWTVRRPTIQTFKLGGNLPFSITSKMLNAMEKGATSELAYAALNPKEQIQAAIFMRDLVLDIVVSPRLTFESQSENDLSPDDLLLEDFNFLGDWAINNRGGREREALNNFRGKSRPNARTGTNGARSKHKRK